LLLANDVMTLLYCGAIRHTCIAKCHHGWDHGLQAAEEALNATLAQLATVSLLNAEKRISFEALQASLLATR
jgi:hypothetical protein